MGTRCHQGKRLGEQCRPGSMQTEGICWGLGESGPAPIRSTLPRLESRLS